MAEFEFLLIVIASGITYLLSHFNASRKIQRVIEEINDALKDNVVTKEELERILKVLTAKSNN
jgi:CHASE3 domain sensor protein